MTLKIFLLSYTKISTVQLKVKNKSVQAVLVFK